MSKNGRTIREKVLALLRDPNYRPRDQTEIAQALGAKGHQKVEVRQILRELEHAGEIARIRKDRYILPAEADLVTGKLSIHQSGFGFLVPEKSGEADIFVAAENTGTAMNGDRVVVRISRDVPPRRGKARPGQKTEGRVIRILERARDTIVGTLQTSKNFTYVVPDDPRIVHNVYVQRPKDPPANIGDKVVVRLEDWQSRHVNPEGEIIEVLGKSDAPGVDMLAIIRKYNLPTEFPKAVVDEANRIPKSVEQRMAEGRDDLRGKFIVTIDPDDARDFDDAIDVEKVNGEGWRLGVHIADVSAYVTLNSALDREARRRGNSVYLPDRVIPMLPERLSNGVCSLNPGVDRLTFSAFIEFDKNGRPKNARFARTVIRSAKRLTYKEAYAILKSKPNGELSHRLHTAWELASLLRRKRFEHGSLDLDFPEVKVYVDANGKPIRLERVENDESHQLIEEFMLAANEAVARELRHRSIPTIYRVHENPDPEKLAEYREFILSFGYKVGDLTQRKEVQRFLASVRGKPEEQALKIGLLKSLKRARYAVQPLGHYGLAKTNYLHFTSPIRRYADLIVHRTLAEQNSSRRSKIDVGQLESLAGHISDTERNAADAEIESVRLKKLQFFQQQLEARNPQVFRAAIVDVRNYGMVVELPDAVMTGLVHVSALTDDFYRFDAAQRRLIGRRINRRYAIGDQIQVFVARVDTFKQQIDFAIADSRPKKQGRRR
ncbi:MAG TPA: ribonuclease R [Chthoniobacterales bacterium]|nr:ribonuclease R [Chthoniobacterales bacterium]